jgi:hypothetical protein
MTTAATGMMPLRERLLRELNSILGPGRMQLPSRDMKPPDEETEQRNAQILARHAVREWFPRILEYDRMYNSASRIRETSDWEGTEQEVLETWERAERTLKETGNTAEAPRLARDLSSGAASLETCPEERRKAIREGMAESAAAMAGVLERTARERGQEQLDTAQECRRLMNLLEDPA